MRLFPSESGTLQAGNSSGWEQAPQSVFITHSATALISHAVVIGIVIKRNQCESWRDGKQTAPRRAALGNTEVATEDKHLECRAC